MSFPNQCFWMAKSSGTPSDSEIAFENASKRPHQWLLDGSDAELLPNKKHAPEIPTGNLFSGVINSNVPAWGNTFCFQSIPGHCTERLFDTETPRAADIHDKSVHSINTEKVIPGRSGIEEPYSDHSFGLSMSHTLEDQHTAVSYGGIRKVKVSQVKDSDSFVSSTNALNYDRTDNRSLSATNTYRVDENSMCMGLAFGKEEENMIPESYERENGVFISMGQPYSKGDENISLAPYNDNNSFASDLTFDKADSNLISMGQTYNHVDESSASKGTIFRKDSPPVCKDGEYNRNGNVIKGQSTIISFGGSNDDDDANNPQRIISRYELLMSQSTPQISETLTYKDLVGCRTTVLGNDVTFSSVDVSAKKEETKVSKKLQSNSFPSNVRSLLSTGMLDGVPVKYVSWSREVANLLTFCIPKVAIKASRALVYVVSLFLCCFRRSFVVLSRALDINVDATHAIPLSGQCI